MVEAHRRTRCWQWCSPGPGRGVSPHCVSGLNESRWRVRRPGLTKQRPEAGVDSGLFPGTACPRRRVEVGEGLWFVATSRRIVGSTGWINQGALSSARELTAQVPAHGRPHCCSLPPGKFPPSPQVLGLDCPAGSRRPDSASNTLHPRCLSPPRTCSNSWLSVLFYGDPEAPASSSAGHRPEKEITGVWAAYAVACGAWANIRGNPQACRICARSDTMKCSQRAWWRVG